MTTRAVRIGIVGTRPEPTLEVVRAVQALPRLTAAAVYCPSVEQGARLAVECDVSAAWSLRRLAASVDGVVVVDAGWIGSAVALLCLSARRPVLGLPELWRSLNSEDLEHIRDRVASAETMFLPGLLRRWEPATLRIRELTATQLGAIESIDLIGSAATLDESLLEELDWCCNVVQSSVHSVACDGETGRVELRFRRKTAAGEPVRAGIRLASAGPGDAAGPLETVVRCRHGRIRLLGQDRLEWITDRRPWEEHLSQERRPSAVALDLFGRRIVGGIVPVPGVDDLIGVRMILAGLRRSAASGREIPLD